MSDNKFFEELGNDSPFMKVALEGFAGSGKTYTAALIAKGLHQTIKSTKPIVIFDTERSSRFLKPMFAGAGIKVLVKESRQLADLITTMGLCGKGESDILLIDSISHIWEAYLEAYKEKHKRTFLQFADWGIIKPTWKKSFSEPLVAARFNIIFTGRAGYEYEQEKNEVTQKKEIVKSGIKMKVEGETAYEPDLLVLMERFEQVLNGDKAKEVWREATILKDRSTLIDGVTFKNPSWDNFKPVFEFLCADVVPERSRAEGDTGELFNTDGSLDTIMRNKKIMLEKIQGMIDQYFPEARGQAKALKAAVIKNSFNTLSQTEIEGMPLEKLQACYDRLGEQLKIAKSDPEEYMTTVAGDVAA